MDGAFGAVNAGAFAAWAAGFALYQWIAPTPVATWRGWLESGLDVIGTGFAPSWLAELGGSIPSFILAAGLALVLAGRPARARSSAGRPAAVTPR